MPNAILSTAPLFQKEGIAFLRITVGLLMVYHGIEVFDSKLIEEYAKWDSIKSLPNPLLMAYAGKSAELVSGILLTIGFLTRPAAILLMFTMLFVTFFIGHGKFWYDDQHPFMMALMALVFIFCGPGKWSLDQLFFSQQKS